MLLILTKTPTYLNVTQRDQFRKYFLFFVTTISPGVCYISLMLYALRGSPSPYSLSAHYFPHCREALKGGLVPAPDSGFKIFLLKLGKFIQMKKKKGCR
jgi:hypothetical protein